MSPMTRRPLALEFALLGFLRQEPLHGYQIHQQITDPEGLGMIWRIKQSQLYAILSRMEDEGYVSSVIQAQEIRPPRRTYRLTEIGRAAFLEWVETPIQNGRQMRQEFLARLYFALKEGKDTAAQLVGRQRNLFRASLANLSLKQIENDTEAGFGDLVLLYRVKYIESALDWLDLCYEKIDQGPKF
jgi:DNA-binding PadR family transcriptional regulator